MILVMKIISLYINIDDLIFCCVVIIIIYVSSAKTTLRLLTDLKKVEWVLIKVFVPAM